MMARIFPCPFSLFGGGSCYLYALSAKWSVCS